jgi:hypothetical protein
MAAAMSTAMTLSSGAMFTGSIMTGIPHVPLPIPSLVRMEVIE